MEIRIALKQHVGAPCKAIVKVGDEVKKGQLIALPDGLGANIHASLSGKVTTIDDAITIMADENQPDDYVKIEDTESNLDAIIAAGVVGAGGAGFPTGIKLNSEALKDGYLMLNAAECEPLLAHNIKFIEENPKLIIRGLQYLLDITKAKMAYIAIKKKHRDAILALSKESKEIPNIELKFLPNMYPAGDERVIVREILGEIMEPGVLPSEFQSVIVNVETLKNCVYAIEDRKPVITKDLTVDGKVKEAKVFLDQPIGMSISHYIDACGGFSIGSGEIVIGGPFTGKRAGDKAAVTKISGGILVGVEFPHDERDFGILACECGADEARLTEIVESMGGRVVASTKCKRMIEVNGRYRCNKPGECPGQAESVLKLKAGGAKVIIAGT